MAAVDKADTSHSAHYHAATDAKLLHRDISAGNILILPKIMWVKDPNHPQKKRLQMKYTGLLVDWEMAKPYDMEKGPLEIHRQVDRTVSLVIPRLNNLLTLYGSGNVAIHVDRIAEGSEEAAHDSG